MGIKGGYLYSSFSEATNAFDSHNGWQAGLFIGGNRAGVLGAMVELNYLKKGSKVYIEGSMRTRKWKDQSGADREIVEVRADVLQLL